MKVRFISILMYLFVYSLTGYAQESNLLERYRSRALEYNQDAQAAEKNVKLREEMTKAAKADYKPKLSAGANFNFTGNPTELSLDIPALGFPLSFQGDHSRYGASVSLTQPVYAGGMVRESVKMARQEGQLAVNQSTLVKSNVCYEADARYWSLVARAEVTVITERYQQSVAKLASVVRERVEVGLVDRNDLLMAEVRLNEADYQRMQAQNNYEVSRITLNSFIGVDFNETTPVDSLIPAIHAVGTFTEQLPDAGKHRAELKMARDKISMQETALKLNDARYQPQFHVGIDGSYSSPGYNFQSDLDPNYVLYAKLSIPLFEWGKRGREKKASTYKIGMARDNYSKVNDNVNLEVQAAHYSFVQAVERVALTESSLTKAKENEVLALERYSEGKISITGVLDAQIYYQTAQINDVQSRLNAQMACSEFMRALGIYQF